MRISIGSLLDGAKQATGAVAIIDVFRAFTTAAVALANGASRIIMVSAVEEALSLRDSGAAQICMGQVRGRPPPGFDFGNSPFEISARIAQRKQCGQCNTADKRIFRGNQAAKGSQRAIRCRCD
jgi:2-phosphosulfolactate phosphatase